MDATNRHGLEICAKSIMCGYGARKDASIPPPLPARRMSGWSWLTAQTTQSVGRGLAPYSGTAMARRLEPNAHRWVYEQLIGPIRPRAQLDHTCHDPAVCALGNHCPHRQCVNPSHLEAVTPRENVLRSGGVCAVNAARIYCTNGHLLDGDNLYIELGNGKRRCRECGRQRQRRYVARLGLEGKRP